MGLFFGPKWIVKLKDRAFCAIISGYKNKNKYVV